MRRHLREFRIFMYIHQNLLTFANSFAFLNERRDACSPFFFLAVESNSIVLGQFPARKRVTESGFAYVREDARIRCYDR